MPDIRTVTTREMLQITNATREKQKTILWHGKKINIVPLLSLKEFFNLVGEILDLCVKDDKIAVEFVDFIFKAKTIEKYGNLVLPEDIEDKYMVIYGSDIVQIVFDAINSSQLESLKRIIEFYTGLKI